MPKTPVVSHDGPEIRQRRVAAGFNTVQFAKRVKCDPDYVSKFELMQTEQIGEPLFNRICRVLGVTDKTQLIAKEAAA